MDLPMVILGFLVFPFAYPFRKDNKFPSWAWLWGNDDDGIDGGDFWAGNTVGKPYWLRCFIWTILRNSTHNYTVYKLGFCSKGEAVRVAGSDTFPIGDTTAEGWYFAREKFLWEFYWIKKSFTGKCFRFRCGWKIMGRKAGEYAPFCFAPSPNKIYTGK